jgi:hypothetical protein
LQRWRRFEKKVIVRRVHRQLCWRDCKLLVLRLLDPLR